MAARGISSDDRFVPTIFQHSFNRRAVFGGAAAAGIAVATLRPPLGLWPSLAELSSDYRTGVGERRSVEIATGLRLELNTRTSVALRSGASSPGIKLIAGEVAATVHLPGSQRFDVFVGNTHVSASSASFDIRKLGEAACITCIDGAVAVHGGRDSVTLRPMEQVSFLEAGTHRLMIVDPSVVAAWRNGKLIFHDISLQDIVVEINRYRSGKIMILNADLAKRRFNGNFEISRIDHVVANLQKLANASVAILPGGIVFLS